MHLANENYFFLLPARLGVGPQSHQQNGHLYSNRLPLHSLYFTFFFFFLFLNSITFSFILFRERMCDLEAEKLVIKFIEVPTVSENDLPEWLGNIKQIIFFS